MEIYNRTLPLLVEGLKTRYPFDPAVYKYEKIWLNALNARAFDSARALLPIGTTTLLSWTTSLRAARDHLRRLKHHPLPEVRETARAIFAGLLAKYPHSFNGDELDLTDTPRDAYATRFAARTHFVSAENLTRQFDLTTEEQEKIAQGSVIARRDAVDLKGLNRNETDLLAARPENAALPWRLESYGRYNFLFLLDFGSFRDLQRHRNGVCQIPLIEGQFGLNPWYVQQWSEHLAPEEVAQLTRDIDAQFDAIRTLSVQGVPATPELTQYLYPMGMQVLVHASYSVPETVYVGELRSGKTVHPSLRPIAQKMLETLEQDIPSLKLYGDRDAESWSAKRGEQTIASKVA